MGGTFQFFAEDMTQHRFIDGLRSFSEVSPQSLVDHGLITETCALRSFQKLI